MKKIVLGLMLGLLIVGCSSDKEDLTNVEPNIVVEKTLSNLGLKDQFEEPQNIDANTKKVIFAFSKDMAHICNDFFVMQKASYLADNDSKFIADVSSAPSVIRSMFILPGIKEFKHTVILLDDKAVAAGFRKGVDVEKIVVAYLDNNKITKVQTVATQAELKTIIESK